MVGQHRSSQHHPTEVVRIKEEKLRHGLDEATAENIRIVRGIADGLLKREGWRVNHKREQQLWRNEDAAALPQEAQAGPLAQKPADGSAQGHRIRQPQKHA